MSATLYSAALLHAANFAAIKHKKQVRKDSTRTPYINHPIGVATILAVEVQFNNNDNNNVTMMVKMIMIMIITNKNI